MPKEKALKKSLEAHFKNYNLHIACILLGYVQIFYTFKEVILKTPIYHNKNFRSMNIVHSTI